MVPVMGYVRRAKDVFTTGVVNELAPYSWSGYEAAHIFPLGGGGLWGE